jgi:hypothetical protein
MIFMTAYIWHSSKSGPVSLSTGKEIMPDLMPRIGAFRHKRLRELSEEFPEETFDVFPMCEANKNAQEVNMYSATHGYNPAMADPLAAGADPGVPKSRENLAKLILSLIKLVKIGALTLQRGNIANRTAYQKHTRIYAATQVIGPSIFCIISIQNFQPRL